MGLLLYGGYGALVDDHSGTVESDAKIIDLHAAKFLYVIEMPTIETTTRAATFGAELLLLVVPERMQDHSHLCIAYYSVGGESVCHGSTSWW
jgi:hypothetical protein